MWVKLSLLRLGYYNKPLWDIGITESGNLNLPLVDYIGEVWKYLKDRAKGEAVLSVRKQNLLSPYIMSIPEDTSWHTISPFNFWLFDRQLN